MALVIDKSYRDVIGLLTDGGILSTNYGLITQGSIFVYKIIEDKGKILSIQDYGDSVVIDIECADNKTIRLSLTYTEGEYYGICEFLQNGETYTLEGQPLVGGTVHFYLHLQETEQQLAWLTSSFSIFTGWWYENQNDDIPSLSFFVVPNAYQTGKEYPSQPPIELIDQKGLSFIRIDIMSDTTTPDLDTQQYTLLWNFLNGITAPDTQYDDGDDVPSGGDGGSYSANNEPVPRPKAPTLSALSSGLVSLYAPTPSQMQSITRWLWSTDFFDNIIKNFADPFNNIIGCYISPVVPASASTHFVIGNVDSMIDVNKVSTGYSTIQCGQRNIKPFYNSFADYDNYRSFKMFLPYYGIVDLSTDDFMGHYIGVQYIVDSFSGIATINIYSVRNGVEHCTHQYSTNLYAPIPFSGVNMMNYIQGVVGASAQLITQGMSGNPLGMVTGITNLISAHPTYGGSKATSNTGGFMGIQYPYLIECRSKRSMPKNYSKYEGIPLVDYKKVSDLTGYTEFESIRVEVSRASEQEMETINNILKEGVIL